MHGFDGTPGSVDCGRDLAGDQQGRGPRIISEAICCGVLMCSRKLAIPSTGFEPHAAQWMSRMQRRAREAVKNAEDSGAMTVYPPTRQGQRGTFAIVIQGGVQHGLWQRQPLQWHRTRQACAKLVGV